ncbi:5-formyltetrahydrofolate cyclo-ligase [Polaribacter litorisediminis]|uniref:5-formyltetrahydrofolate cyclo-ligase n=1 Tax=Polaribacter litorisediminis TaxID=1908341 RepID=UPI001CBECAD9|nr:5-formyltetrahydrofolate cyclo-ligase [Polaribacter litorisediminis]UAM97074.1 5-formyltetrahydrofolate cyclo-ligase [Polaribacter litorisediminis]
MIKSELRKIYKLKRNALIFEQIQKMQENIYNQIYDLDISEINNIHIFLTLDKFKEISTTPIIDYFRKHQKRIIVSKSDFTDNTLTHFYLEENTEIVISKHGIPEPKNAESVLETEIDLVFVPLLISNNDNYRIGYGKGFYDRFLSKCKKDVKKIGLNFFKPIAKIDDINAFDVPLDDVMYPK